MFYITQLLYVISGKEALFHQFEALAIPLLAKYNGRLLLRIRPEAATVVEAGIETPYEIHLVQFDSAADFEAFKKDDSRKNFLSAKGQSVREAWLIGGLRL